MENFFSMLFAHGGILVVVCSGFCFCLLDSSVNAEVGMINLATQSTSDDCVHLQQEKWVLKSYFDKYGALEEGSFNSFKENELAPCSCEVVENNPAYGDVAVFGDTNLELPSFLSNRSAVELHMDLGFKKALKLKGGLEINVEVPLHARYPAPGENGYSSVQFGECDVFMHCTPKLNLHSQRCLSILMAGYTANPTDSSLVWEIPSGIQTHSGFISTFTFLSAAMASITVIASSLFYSRRNPGNIKQL